MEQNRKIRIFSWNINGLRAVVNNGTFDAFLDQENPDILCLQETKINEDTLESAKIREKGLNQFLYHAIIISYTAITCQVLSFVGQLHNTEGTAGIPSVRKG